MAAREITAIYPSAEDAHAALERLREIGIADERIRISAQCALHVEVSGLPTDRVVNALREAGALDLNCTEWSDDPGWMSHLCGRILGSKVQPGEGDAEAGSTGERRR